MLSVIIPAKNERYLEETVRDVLANARGEIEVLVELDAWLPDPQIHLNDDRVIFHYHEKPIGQRALINHGASVSRGTYIMKLDAHCAVDEGFDVKLAADCKYEWTVVPRMYNLDIDTWKPKLHKRTDYMYITSPQAEKPFRAMYYGSKQPKNDKLLDETMCCMGPGWFMHKQRFFDQGGCDEGHVGGWGQQGIEVSLKAWLSGGALIVNKKTWFAHWFRGGAFNEHYSPGFPYRISGNQVEKVREYSKDLWLNDKWPLAKRKLQWVIDKFEPKGWNMRNDLTILFYTANVVSNSIMNPVVRSLRRQNYPIVSVSQRPMNLGKNFVVPKERSLQNIYRQVLKAAKEATTKYVALCEDDCLYTPEHFKYVPKDKPFAYNLNRWNLHLDEGVFSYRKRPILSQCIAEREKLIEILEAREGLAEIPDKYCGELGVFDKQLGVKDYGHETFETTDPNIVICHNRNTMGRKYVADDAEPRTELPRWGKIDYWLRKFRKSDDTPKLRNQKSHIHGRSYTVRHIIDNLEWYWDYRKKSRLPHYQSAIKFFKDLADGKMFTDEDLRQHPYFEYRKMTFPKDVRNRPDIDQRCIDKMKQGIEIFHDVKKNGFREPLDAWIGKGTLNIHRGMRKLAVANALGHRNIAMRIYRNREMLSAHEPDQQWTYDDSIHGLGVQQLMKLGWKATDKYWIHNYLRHYDAIIGPHRDKVKKVLEIGVKRGASILLWRDVFKDADIYGVDINIEQARLITNQDRIQLFQGDQKDDNFMKGTVYPNGPFDLIVDDASHIARDQKACFKSMWESVAPGGFYVVEDLFRNYYEKIDTITMMDVIKESIDKMNLECQIKAVHTYYNICFIQKR